MARQLAFDFSTAAVIAPDARPRDVARVRRATGYFAGQAAEFSVARDYEHRGYVIAGTRWRGTAGEIDLIVQDGDAVIFVEVKKSRSFARAADRVSPNQMARICATAEEYLGTQPRGLLSDVRFDVALVDAIGAVRVIENAFEQH